MIYVLLLHSVLLIGLGGILLIYYQKRIRFNMFFTLLFCVILSVFVNLSLSSDSLIGNATINILIYALFIKWTFHKNVTDSFYLSISYWICIEIIDLVLQYLKIMNIFNGSNYILMMVLVIFTFIPYLMMQNVEKKFIVFVLPIILCLFMVQILENEKLFSHTFIFILIGLFVSNICYIYFFSFTIKNLQLRKEKESLNNQIQIIRNHYNQTFYFLHDLIHMNQSIHLDLQNDEYKKVKEDFTYMNSKIIKKFNSIYTGNISLSAAICSIDCENIDIQHMVLCDLDEFNQNELTEFFINTLNQIIKNNTESLYITIKSIGHTKIIQFKTGTDFDFKCIEKETKKFIKKYKLRIQIEEKSITFLHLNAK